jgi:RNA polymerase sigma-70 factor, ECF subfamily
VALELEDVFRDHQRGVYVFFVRLVGNRADAEELTQETFLRACRAALRFRGDSSVRTWLFGIARNVLLESSRRGLFDRPHPLEAVDLPAASLDHDIRMDLEREFATLSFSDRETLMLVDFLGFTPLEAARLTGTAADAFRMRLHRARRRLRERMEVLQP